MSPKVSPPPALPDPVRLPSPDDPDILASRKKKAEDEFANRRGRESTNLSGEGAAGSVQPYARTSLG